MTQIHDLSVRALARAIRDRELDAVEVTRHTLERAERLGPRVGAFVTLAPDLAMAQARRADERLRSGDDAPLLGVPCPVKDLNAVSGLPLYAGSAALRDVGYTATTDDGTVARLGNAGSVMVGKTSTPEFGLPCYTEPDGLPPAATPWDLSRGAGGSSGGAAAAVASRIVPVAHASDGGGSIRIPAAACGLVGLKPARGRITNGPDRADHPLATQGFVTRDVRDTALMLDVLARPWPGDVYTPARGATSYVEACDLLPRPLRIGVLTTPVIVEDTPVHSEALRAVDRAVRHLTEQGHHLEEAPAPFTAEDWSVFSVLWGVMALSVPAPADTEHLMRPLTRWLRAQGRRATGLEVFEAELGIQVLGRQVARRWEPYDVVLTPTLAAPPAHHGTIRNDADPAADFQAQCEFTPWTSMANIAGLPSLSLPLHRAEVDGVTLPFGVMLTATGPREDLLLALGAALEEADPWAGTLPDIG